MNNLPLPTEDYIFPDIHEANNELVFNAVDPTDLVARKVVREKIESFADQITGAINSEVVVKEEGVLTHYHTKGIYAREMFIPRGTVMVSKLHKLPRFCIISSGDVSIVSEYGCQRVQGHYAAVFKPGTRVALFTHTDTIWTAIHGTDETDLDALESTLIAEDHEAYEAFCELFELKLGGE